MPNRLAEETSPYLLQHKDNPVDWRPWGLEALAEAEAGDKPILLSIGYSACHWCHVMERESFEDAETAAYMNENFVPIKVDREERPDVDDIYMEAVQGMTGQGGWPLTVFLDPEGVPFYGGTYFPPEPRHGLPSFRQVLEATAEGFRGQREELRAASDRVREGLSAISRIEQTKDPLTTQLLDASVRGLLANADTRNGGFGGAPKFPPASTLEFLMARGEREHVGAHARRDDARRHLRPGRRRLRPLLRRRLLARPPLREDALRQRAARSGLPARVAAHRAPSAGWRSRATRSTGRCARCTAPRAASTPRSTPTPRARRAASTSGTRSEAREAMEGEGIASEEIERVLGYWGVSAAGNFEGRNILHVPLGASAKPPPRLAEARRVLLAAREQRVRPGLDDKRLTSWNALMISALADAGAALDRPDYLDAAAGAARFIWDELRDDEGHLLRTWKDGARQAERLPRGPRLPARGPAAALRGDPRACAGSTPPARPPTR